jgi:aspartyl-tRNA synthetase
MNSESISAITNTSHGILDAFILPNCLDAENVSQLLRNNDRHHNDNGESTPFVLEYGDEWAAKNMCSKKSDANAAEAIGLRKGDALLVQSRHRGQFAGGSTELGRLRLALHRYACEQSPTPIVNKSECFNFLWVTDFPLFSPSTDEEPGQGGERGLTSTHHPFTAPKSVKDVELLDSSPELAKAAHYDLVVNGVELGGGSRRIHVAAVQEHILRNVLRIPHKRIEDFRHLLNVLRHGCPPHAGIALGFDRLVAVMLGLDSLRDVIAFPKSGGGEDWLVKSPNTLTKEQLDTYHLRLVD